jgi:hypothetical protein
MEPESPQRPPRDGRNVNDFDEKLLNPSRNLDITLERSPTLRVTASIREFLYHVSRFAMEPMREDTKAIHRSGDIPDEYDRGRSTFGRVLGASRPVRCLDSVVMDTTKQDELVADITNYMTSGSRRLYADSGVLPERLASL